jgi:hypothetical protein
VLSAQRATGTPTGARALSSPHLSLHARQPFVDVALACGPATLINSRGVFAAGGTHRRTAPLGQPASAQPASVSATAADARLAADRNIGRRVEVVLYRVVVAFVLGRLLVRLTAVAHWW